MEPERTGWANFSLAQKVRLVGELVIKAPYIVGKVMWDDFDYNHSKDIAIPKISFRYDPDIIHRSDGMFLRYYVNIEHAYERRLFGIKREVFSTGGSCKSRDIEINSSPYLEEKVLEKHAPQIANLTYKMLYKNEDDSPVKYTLLEIPSPIVQGIELKPFPETVLSAIKKNLDEIILL